MLAHGLSAAVDVASTVSAVASDSLSSSGKRMSITAPVLVSRTNLYGVDRVIPLDECTLAAAAGTSYVFGRVDPTTTPPCTKVRGRTDGLVRCGSALGASSSSLLTSAQHPVNSRWTVGLRRRSIAAASALVAMILVPSGSRPISSITVWMGRKLAMRKKSACTSVWSRIISLMRALGLELQLGSRSTCSMSVALSIG